MKIELNKILISIVIIVLFITIIFSDIISSSSIEFTNNLMSKEINIGELVINEIMSSNDGAHLANDGKSYDWIELYNGTEQDINLKNYGLSDEQDKEIKWLFPDVIIKKKEYLVLYLSGSEEDGHVSFSLKKDGGELVTLKNVSGKVIDSVETDSLKDNDVMARDSNGKWIITDQITPGYSNNEDGRNAYVQSLYELSEDLIITEILPSNKGIFYYEGNLPSYIEIKNNSKDTIKLNDYYLSDDEFSLYKWNFPTEELKSGESYLVFTDNLNIDNHASFTIDKDSGKIFLVKKGKIVNFVQYDNISRGLAYLKFDDKFIQTNNISPGYDNEKSKLEFSSNLDKTHKDLIISEVMSANHTYLEHNGVYYDWIEIYNNSSSDINLSNYYLSNDYNNHKLYRLPNKILKSKEYYVLLASGNDSLSDKKYNHVNFKISSEQDLYLFNNDKLVDSMYIYKLPIGYSYGRNTNYGHYYYSNPTPLKVNNKGFLEISYNPVFNIEGGIFNNVNELEVTISAPGTIYYTTDGSIPTNKSKKYEGVIKLKETTVIKAVAYENNKKSSEVITNSYIINENHTMPVISVSLPKQDFTELNNLYWTDNTYQAHAELFEEEGKFSVGCGIKIFGGDSRQLPKKSFSLKFSTKYGPKNLSYKVFDNRDSVNYKTLVLRSGSQDMEGTMFKDELVTSIIDDYGTVDVQANKPVILYINGQYYGIYFIREKIDETFVSNHYNSSSVGTNIARIDYDVTTGSNKFLKELNTYVSTHDMSMDKHYNYVSSKLDIDNFIDYWINQIYTGDYDVRNTRYFINPNVNNGKIKMISYDFDYAFFQYPENYFTWMTNVEGMGYYKIDNTLMINLLRNEKFKKRFLERLSYNLKYVWTDSNVISRYNEYYNIVKKEIKRDRERWGFSYSKWQQDCDTVKNFLTNRRSKIIKQAKNFFNLSDKDIKKYF